MIIKYLSMLFVALIVKWKTWIPWKILPPTAAWIYRKTWCYKHSGPLNIFFSSLPRLKQQPEVTSEKITTMLYSIWFFIIHHFLAMWLIWLLFGRFHNLNLTLSVYLHPSDRLICDQFKPQCFNSTIISSLRRRC